MIPNASRALLLLLVCLTTVSLGASGRELAPRFIGHTPNETVRPVIAFAGERFLTVWSERVGLAGSVMMGAFSDANGRRVSQRAFPLDVEVSDPTTMQLVGMGDRYALFSQTHDRSAQIAYIDLEGNVTAVRALELTRWEYFRVAWNGTHFLAIGRRVAAPRTEVVLFDQQGRIVGGPFAFEEAMLYRAIVVTTENRFIVLSSNGSAVAASAITTNGVEWTLNVSGRRSQIVTVAAAPTPEGGVLVIWSAHTSTGSELRSAIVRSDRSIAPSVLVGTKNLLTLPAVMHTASGYVIVYTTHQANQQASFVQRLNALGEPVGSPADLSLRSYYAPAAAAGPQTLVIAYVTAPGSSRTATVAIDADGVPREPEVVSINDSRQTTPVLSSMRGDAVAGWTEVTGNSETVRTAHVDSEGNATGVHEIASGRLGANGLAWNGSEHLAVYRTATQVVAVRLGPDGRRTDPQPIVLDTPPPRNESAIAAVWSGDRWLVVWASGRVLRIASVSTAGVASAARTLDVHRPLRDGWEREIEPPSLAFDGERVLLSSSLLDIPYCMMPACDASVGEAVAALLTPDGTLLDRLNLGIASQVRTSVATSSVEFMLLAGTRAFVIEARHDRLRVTATRDVFDWPAVSDVTWDGANYVVALRYAGVNWYLATRRLDYTANDVAAPRGRSTLTPYDFAPPRIVPVFRGDTLVGVQEGTARDGMRAVVYRERDLPALAPPPSPPQNVRAYQFNSYTWIWSWEPSAVGEPELYVVETPYYGEWVPTRLIPAQHGRMSVTVYSPVVRVRAFNGSGPSAPGGPGAAGGKRRSVR